MLNVAASERVPIVLVDAHTQHRGMVVEIGKYRGVALPIKLSRAPATYRVGPPLRDEA